MAFLGIRISPEIGRMLNGIEVPGVKESPSEYHITILCFDDNWPITEVSKALEATFEIAEKQKPFTIKVNKINSFPKREGYPLPIIARVESEDLHKLSDNLKNKFNKENIDFKKNFKDYNPHITLAYSDDLDECEEFGIDEISFTVQDLVLWGGDYGDSRLFVNFQLKQPEKHAKLISKVDLFYKNSKGSFYAYDDSFANKFLETYASEDSKQSEFSDMGSYTNYYFDVVPLDSIQVKSSWDNQKLLTNLNRMKEGHLLNPVKLQEIEMDKFVIIDGIHRVLASKELKYTHIPALIQQLIKEKPIQTESSLYDKINMFYKLSFIDPDGYLTPTHERRQKQRNSI